MSLLTMGLFHRLSCIFYFCSKCRIRHPKHLMLEAEYHNARTLSQLLPTRMNLQTLYIEQKCVSEFFTNNVHNNVHTTVYKSLSVSVAMNYLKRSKGHVSYCMEYLHKPGILFYSLKCHTDNRFITHILRLSYTYVLSLLIQHHLCSVDRQYKFKKLEINTVDSESNAEGI